MALKSMGMEDVHKQSLSQVIDPARSFLGGKWSSIWWESEFDGLLLMHCDEFWICFRECLFLAF